jgi:hypothetical protein
MSRQEEYKEILTIFDNAKVEDIKEIVFLESVKDKNSANETGVLIYANHQDKLFEVPFGYDNEAHVETRQWNPHAIEDAMPIIEKIIALQRGYDTEKLETVLTSNELALAAGIPTPLKKSDINFEGHAPTMEDLSDIDGGFENADLGEIYKIIYFDGWADYEEDGELLVFRNSQNELFVIERGYSVMVEAHSNPWVPRQVTEDEAFELIADMVETVNKNQQTFHPNGFKM